jgi:hypothetical protein
MRRFTLWMLLLVLGAFSADRNLAGRYTGEWKSGSADFSGAIRMTLAMTPDGSWTSETTFTVDGADVPTTTHQMKLQDSKLDASYNFEAQGTKLRCHMTGQWDGNAFKGHYETSVIDGDTVDAGTWSASRAK